MKKKLEGEGDEGDHSFSTFAKFSGKFCKFENFVRVRIRG